MITRLPKDPAYRRLRASNIPAGRTSYWLASDHLLMVERTLIVERYRRFELSDLEVLVIQPNSWRRNVSLFLTPFLVGLIAATAFAGARVAADPTDSDTVVWLVLATIPTALLSGALGWVVFPGQFCRTQLSSGVQTLNLGGLNRLPRARQFAREIHDAVLARGDGSEPQRPVDTEPQVPTADNAPAPLSAP